MKLGGERTPDDDIASKFKEEGGLLAPNMIVTFDAAYCLLNAIERVCPEVLEDLLSRWIPLPEHTVIDLEDWTYKTFEYMTEWMRKYNFGDDDTNLGSCCVARLTLSTIHTWVEEHRHTGVTRPLRFARRIPYFNPSKGLVYPGPRESYGSFRPIAKLPSSPPFSFEFDAWQPYEEPRSAWETLCRAEFEKALSVYLSDRDPGGQKTPEKDKDEHFEWTALYLCGSNSDGSVGWSYGRIAAKYFDEDEELDQDKRRVERLRAIDRVKKAVKRTLELVDLPRRGE